MSEEIQEDPSERPRRSRERDRDPDRDAPRRRRRDVDDEDDPDRFRQDTDATVELIPYKNPKALLSYYCGVFSIIPCAGLILGPVALVLGILGLRYVKRFPTASGTAHAITGLVLGGLSTLFNWGGVLFLVAGAGLAAMK